MSNVHRKEELFKHLLELAETLDWTAARESDAETALLAKTLKTFFGAVKDSEARARLERALDLVSSPSQSEMDSMINEILYGLK
jgi:hypothetical protein